MEDILQDINNETKDLEMKSIIESISSLDLEAEEMEANLIKSKLFVTKREDDIQI